MSEKVTVPVSFYLPFLWRSEFEYSTCISKVFSVKTWPNFWGRFVLNVSKVKLQDETVTEVEKCDEFQMLWSKITDDGS